jgi:hypothetical protein
MGVGKLQLPRFLPSRLPLHRRATKLPAGVTERWSLSKQQGRRRVSHGHSARPSKTQGRATQTCGVCHPDVRGVPHRRATHPPTLNILPQIFARHPPSCAAYLHTPTPAYPTSSTEK